VAPGISSASGTARPSVTVIAVLGLPDEALDFLGDASACAH